MANPRIFISSTCYDLSLVRAELRSYIIEHGFDPVMSENSDILYNPHHHTHTSCIKEIDSCDMLVFIIGSRYGGKGVPEALKNVNISADIKDDKNLSITQLEVLKAIEAGVPVFSFVLEGVLNDHKTYERNKDKVILKDIEFPNIENQDTAKYIFEFINFIRLQPSGNSLTAFTKLEDIKKHLTKQWAALFQRLLYEQKIGKKDQKQIDYLSNQIADIKTAVLTSLTTSDLKDTARGAIKYRRMIEFLAGLYDSTNGDVRTVLKEKITWDSILKDKLGVVDVKEDNRRNSLHRTVFILHDNTYLTSRYPTHYLNQIAQDWNEFCGIPDNSKDAIINATIDNSERGMMFRFRRFYEPYVEQEDENELDENKPPF